MPVASARLRGFRGLVLARVQAGVSHAKDPILCLPLRLALALAALALLRAALALGCGGAHLLGASSCALSTALRRRSRHRQLAAAAAALPRVRIGLGGRRRCGGGSLSSGSRGRRGVGRRGGRGVARARLLRLVQVPDLRHQVKGIRDEPRRCKDAADRRPVHLRELAALAVLAPLDELWQMLLLPAGVQLGLRLLFQLLDRLGVVRTDGEVLVDGLIKERVDLGVEAVHRVVHGVVVGQQRTVVEMLAAALFGVLLLHLFAIGRGEFGEVLLHLLNLCEAAVLALDHLREQRTQCGVIESVRA